MLVEDEFIFCYCFLDFFVCYVFLDSFGIYVFIGELIIDCVVK